MIYCINLEISSHFFAYEFSIALNKHTLKKENNKIKKIVAFLSISDVKTITFSNKSKHNQK